MSDLELSVKEMIIEALNLEGMTPQDIDCQEPLFGEGLGLDSIDALELGVAIHQKFKVRIDSEDENIKTHFASVRNLSLYIARLGGSVV